MKEPNPNIEAEREENLVQHEAEAPETGAAKLFVILFLLIVPLLGLVLVGTVAYSLWILFTHSATQ